MIDYNDLTKNIKDGLKFPTGATSERGTPSKGSLRFNSETGKPEIYAKSRGWKTAAQESSGSYSYLTTDLLVDLDAANSNSYSGSGSTWTDLQGNLNMQKDPNNNSAYTNTGYNSNGWFEMGPDRYPNWMDIPHSWASTSNVDSLLSGTVFSMDIWVRFIADSNQEALTLVSQGYHNYGIILSQYTINSGNINFNNYYAYNSGWLTSWIYNVNLPIVDFGNRWVHLVYTYEESTVDSYGDYPGGYPSNLIKFYVDGAFVAEDYSQRGVGTTSSYGTGPLRLGGSYNSSHSSANVDLSSLRLYDKTLSATEIADNFNNTKSRFGL